MNTLKLPLPANSPRIARVATFTLLALPGAWLVGTCGSLIVNAAFNAADIWLCTLLGILLAVGAKLLLYGTRTHNEPLFLLVFVPMPILLTVGFQFGYLGKDIGLLITLAALVAPVIAYRPISRYYKRKATRVLAADSGMRSERSVRTSPLSVLTTSNPITGRRLAGATLAAEQSTIYHVSLASHIMRVTDDPRSTRLQFRRLPNL